MSEEFEKPFFVQRFNGVSNGIDNIFSHSTACPNWHAARRGASPSFSMSNVSLALPWINRKTGELKKMLMDRHSTKYTFDLPKLMSHLTLDMICGGISI
jgi:cytochrome P450